MKRGVILLFIVIFSFVAVAQNSVDFGSIDCDDNPNDDPQACIDARSSGPLNCDDVQYSVCAECIHPGAREVCNDNVDNNCNMDNNEDLDNDPATGKDGSFEANPDAGDISCLRCGDGVINPGEDCNTCLDLRCEQNQNCLPGNSGADERGCVQLGPECGNNVQEEGEQCDDGNIVNNDGCSSTCNYELVDPGEEGCPEGSSLCGDGTCSLNCWATSNDYPSCNNNNQCETGEGCNCGDCDNRQDTCSAGLSCSSVDVACCDDIRNGECNPYCSSVDPDCGGVFLEQNPESCQRGSPDGICGFGESCICPDCSGRVDGCSEGNICSPERNVCGCNTAADGFCTLNNECKSQDPDCCEINTAYWDAGNAVGICSADGKDVRLVAEGANCDNRRIELSLYEEETGDDDLVESFNERFVRGRAIYEWDAVYIDDGLMQGNPEYYFTVDSLSSELLEVRDCDLANDVDCDRICDPGKQSDKCVVITNGDECPSTPLCANVDEDTGCSRGQASCIVEWDCTPGWWNEQGNTRPNWNLQDSEVIAALTWSECNENDIRTRNIGDCSSLNQDRCYCKLPESEQCRDVIALPAPTRNCLGLEEFPFFTNLSLIITVAILVVFYIFRKK